MVEEKLDVSVFITMMVIIGRRKCEWGF